MEFNMKQLLNTIFLIVVVGTKHVAPARTRRSGTSFEGHSSLDTDSSFQSWAGNYGHSSNSKGHVHYSSGTYYGDGNRWPGGHPWNPGYINGGGQGSGNNGWPWNPDWFGNPWHPPPRDWRDSFYPGFGSPWHRQHWNNGPGYRGWRTTGTPTFASTTVVLPEEQSTQWPSVTPSTDQAVYPSEYYETTAEVSTVAVDITTNYEISETYVTADSAVSYTETMSEDPDISTYSTLIVPTEEDVENTLATITSDMSKTEGNGEEENATELDPRLAVEEQDKSNTDQYEIEDNPIDPSPDPNAQSDVPFDGTIVIVDG